MQLAVGGHLKQSKWLDRTTGMQREALRVCSNTVATACASTMHHNRVWRTLTQIAPRSHCASLSCNSEGPMIRDNLPGWLQCSSAACMHLLQVVAEYLMIVDSSRGVLEASAAAGQPFASMPRKAAQSGRRASDAAQTALRLYNEGHSLSAIVQTVVSCLRPARKGVVAQISQPDRA